MSEFKLFEEISVKTLAIYLDSRQWLRRFWPDFFPEKTTPFLTFESLIGEGRISSADFVSYNSSAPLKTRRTIAKLKGDIPAIRVAREKDENDYNSYNIIKATAKSDKQMQDLIAFVFDDVAFCVEAVQNRLEWLCLQALSQINVGLNPTNNAGIVTETDVNFGMREENKLVTSAEDRYWTVANKLTALPITDLLAICKTMRASGVKLEWVLMTPEKFGEFRSSAEVRDYCYGLLLSESGILPSISPTLGVINKALKETGLPQVILMDCFVDIENGEHDIVAVNPFEDSAGSGKKILLTPALPLGNMLFGPVAAATVVDPGSIKSMVGNILVQSLSSQDPISVKTLGLTNAFVDWQKVDQCVSLNTESHTSW